MQERAYGRHQVKITQDLLPICPHFTHKRAPEILQGLLSVLTITLVGIYYELVITNCRPFDLYKNMQQNSYKIKTCQSHSQRCEDFQCHLVVRPPPCVQGQSNFHQNSGWQISENYRMEKIMTI